MSKKYIGDLAFDASCVFAETPSGERIKFSRLERALLRRFHACPGILLSRNQLLDCIDQVDGGGVDRNVDYLLSRLRRKLGDSARTPKYIATQYGEGYMWVAKSHPNAPHKNREIYLSIGPIYGRTQAGNEAEPGGDVIVALQQALQVILGADRIVEPMPQPDVGSASDALCHANASYSLEVSFLSLEGASIFSLIVLNRKTGQIFASFRENISDEMGQRLLPGAVERLAERIKNSIWDARIFRADEQVALKSDPLVVGLYKASMMFEPGIGNLADVEERLRSALQQDPNNHHAAVLLANMLQTKRLGGEFSDFSVYTNSLEKEKETELLLLKHLPGIQNDALYLAAAAERLDDLGHTELAESLAERALDIGPSFAACYMVIGRIRAHQGYIEEGISYYEHSLQIAEKDSAFYMMILTMRCMAYKAVADQDKVLELAPYIVDREEDPFKKAALQLYFFSDIPAHFSPDLAKMLSTLPVDTARNLILVCYFVAARAFRLVQHRENHLRGCIDFFVEQHGPAVVPEIVRQAVPELCESRVAPGFDGNSI